MGNETSTNRQGRTSSNVIASPSVDDPNLLRHPYIDPDTGMAHDTNHPQKEGVIWKKSEWVKEWRER